MEIELQPQHVVSAQAAYPLLLTDLGEKRRVGVIDCGSNAMRAAVAELDGTGYRIREKLRRPVRLGADAFSTGSLSGKTIARALAAFSDFDDLFESHGVDEKLAVATSALRSSENGSELVARILRTTGIELRTITPHREAALVRAAVFSTIEEPEELEVIADLGGGSLEVQVVHRGMIIATAALPIGTVRLGALGVIESARMREIRSAVLEGLDRNLPRLSRPMAVTLCGGNAKALAKLFPDPRHRGQRTINGYELDENLVGLCRLGVDSRMDKYSLRRDRAEVIATAAIIFNTLWQWFERPILAVPGVGVLHGILEEALSFPRI